MEQTRVSGNIFDFQNRILYLTTSLSTSATLLLWDVICQTSSGFRWFFRLPEFFFQLGFVWTQYSYLEPPMLSPLVVLIIISPDFATCSLVLHNHCQRCNQVFEYLREPYAKHLSVHAFLGERSEAYSHKEKSKWFQFLTVRDISLQCISLNLSFSAPIGLIFPTFV